MQNVRELIGRIYDHKRFSLVAYGLIAVLVLVAYANTFNASFHFDDNPAIIENPNIRYVTMDNIMTILQGLRPMVNLSIMLNYQLSALNVAGWHAFNIGVHILCSIFLYRLILNTLQLPVLGNRYEVSAKRMALFGALLYAVHPIQTESVTYIISRSELLATVFYLPTFLLLIRFVRTGKFFYVIGMFLTSVCSMSSKEWAVTLPALLVLYDYLFLAEGSLRKVLSRGYIYVLVALPWWLVLSNLNLTSQGGTSGVGFNLEGPAALTPWSYFLTSMNVLWTYVRLMFVPINQNLDYDYYIARTLFELPTFASFLGHLLVVGGCFWMYITKKWRLIPFGMAWFYIGLSPTQSIVPIVDVIFEHRMYMPSAGIILAFLVAYEGVFQWIADRKAVNKAAA